MADVFQKIDTKAFDAFISKRSELLSEYDEINLEYDRIIFKLLSDWKGKGAEAFRADSERVKANIVGIYDVLKMFCDILEDCRDVFAKVDKDMGDYNRNPK